MVDKEYYDWPNWDTDFAWLTFQERFDPSHFTPEPPARRDDVTQGK